MIYLKLKGGLGNQLFQYAMVRKLQIDSGDEVIMDIQRILTSKIANAGYALPFFKISEQIKLHSEKTKLPVSFYFKFPIYQLFRCFFAVIGKAGDISWQYALEKRFQPILNRIGIYFSFAGYVAPAIPRSKMNIVDGYFQSPKYFDDIRSVVCTELKVKTPVMEKNLELLSEIESSNSVCVHIRRGDYVNNPLYMVCNEKYYQDAMDTIAQRVLSPHFYIFSDSIDWVQTNMIFSHPVTFIQEGNPNYEELRLMYSCKHFIISNSSFSWWAQYLGTDSEKLVVAPNHWFATGETAGQDIYQAEWILVQP